VADRTDTGGTVHAQPGVAFLADGGLPCVQAHPHAQLRAGGPLVLGECTLGDDGRCEC
jgi:hypothetical protein